MVKLTEADIRLEINKALENKGWKLQGFKKNVFVEQYIRPGYADYELKPHGWKNPLVIIEAKKRGEDLNSALEQAKKYALVRQTPIIYATDGNVIKTLHLGNLKPLILNGEEVDEFLSEELALNFQHTNEYNSLDRRIIESRRELIQVFAIANKELRKEGLQAGIERFSEFCNILFLKLFSEQEVLKEKDKRSAPNKLIKKEYHWDYFKNLEGKELLHYVNERVLNYFQEKYGQDIFSPLQLKNPATLKRIIEKLDNLSLTDINSDIKGDAFEYFLKAYLSKQQKDLGEYFTPRHIVKFLVKLTNPKFGETVYDPFCGTGGILIEVFRHIYQKMPRESKKLQILKNNTIYGGEIT